MHVLKISGSPKERGQQHGESYRTEINELLEIRRGLISPFLSKFTKDEQEALFARQVDALRSEAELFEEFEAIASSAAISLNDLMVLNNYTDMRDFINEDPGDDGCSVFFLKNSKGTFSGQTWDMHASATPYVLALEIEDEEDACQIVTVTGCLALAGFSKRGVGVMINNMHCTQTDARNFMWPALVRKLLKEARSSTEALQVLEGKLPSSGHNYLLADSLKGINVETTGTQSKVTGTVESDGFLFHTNHYVSPLKEFENLERQSKSTHKRYEELERIFSGPAWKDWTQKELTHAILLSESSKVLCIPETPEHPHKASTCGGILIDHNTGKGLIFKGLYQEKQHREFSYSKP